MRRFVGVKRLLAPQETAFAEREIAFPVGNHVINQREAQDFTHVGKSPRHTLIRIAGVRVTAGVVVGNDPSRQFNIGVGQLRMGEHLSNGARVCDGLVERANVDNLAVDHLVSPVHHGDFERLKVGCAHRQIERRKIRGRVQHRAANVKGRNLAVHKLLKQ